MKKRESSRTSSAVPGRPGFALVLHTHLPFVLNHGRWPHGSDWLNEATVECYLPLLDAARRLAAEGISPRWTINISPVLAEQLASPVFQKEIEFFIETRLRYVEDNRGYFRQTGQAELVALTHYWEEYFQRMWGLLRGVGGDIVGAFAELGAAGHLEIITCAATHGYLPLLSRDESIHLQLRTAVETHTRHFGRPPRGIWLPECAYRPRSSGPPRSGPARLSPCFARGSRSCWPGTGSSSSSWTATWCRSGTPLSAYRDFYPALAELSDDPPAARVASAAKLATPYRAYRVASRGGTGSAVAFVRDPQTTFQVWSRDQGTRASRTTSSSTRSTSPAASGTGGSPARAWTSGTRSCITRRSPPSASRATPTLPRPHPVHPRRGGPGAGGAAPVVVSPYDSELFGHWWFEGPAWLEAVARRLAANGVQPVTLADALDRGSPPT